MMKIKKILPLAIFYATIPLLPAMGQAQTPGTQNQDSVSYNFVLVEEFGGTWCTSCPALIDSLSAVAQQIDNMAIIGYHSGETRPEVSFLYNFDAYGRSGYYDTIRALPSAFVNGKEVEKTNQIRYEIEKAAIQKTPYELQLEVSHFPDRMASRDSFLINIHIQRVAHDTDRILRLQLAFTQDHMAFKWFNQTEVNHALTFMYPNSVGTMVELDETGSADLRFSFGSDYAKSRFPVKNGSIIAFIQDETIRGYDTLPYSGKIRPRKDNTILQADKVYLGDGDYTHFDGDVSGADFHNRNAEIADRQSAHYYDNTFGKVDSYQWTFEGGEPAVSDLASPTVFYAEPGCFATTLTVTQNGRTSTIRKENVISVLNVRPKFTIHPSTAKPGQPIDIHLTSEADSCTWLFLGGDPLTAEGKDVSVTYPYEGSYSIKASVFYKSPATNASYSFDSTSFNIINISQNAASNPATLQSTIQIKRISGSRNFSITGTEGKLEYADIFSVEGKRVLRTNRTEFDLSALPNAVYIVSVKLAGNPPVSFKINK